MKKYTGQEWAFFRNRAGRIQFNSVCRSCRNRCKQSFRAEILSCRRYESRKSCGKHRKTDRISQGLWKQENDTRNRSGFSPNRAGEKGEDTARFRVFLCRFKESIPKQEKQTRHHRCRHHGGNFYCLQIQIINERGISMNVKNEIKSIIVRSGMTMQQVVELLSDEYGWSDSISNFSNKLTRGSLRYREAIQIADVMGYDLVWHKRRDG